MNNTGYFNDPVVGYVSDAILNKNEKLTYRFIAEYHFYLFSRTDF